MLAHSGRVCVSQTYHDPPALRSPVPEHLKDARNAHVRLVLDDAIAIHYDLHDSWEIDLEMLQQVDVYFKRSFAPDAVAGIGPLGAGVLPLGLYHYVFPRSSDWLDVTRAWRLGSAKHRLQAAIRTVPLLDRLRYVPRVQRLEAPVDLATPARVLFMARAWEPHHGNGSGMAMTSGREAINEMRAECVRRLRAAFGSRFFGGLIPTPYARRHFPDVLVPDPALTSRRKYIALVKRHSIGIATTGLHGSIGGKFAEYLAASRAVVSEHLNYVVPGGLTDGTHYLGFATAQECVERVGQLFENAALRHSIMKEGRRYYREFARPDALVLNSIQRAREVVSTSGREAS